MGFRTGCAGDYPHPPPTHSGFALHAQIEQIGYFGQESEFAFAQPFNLLQPMLFFRRRLGARFPGGLIEFLLFASLFLCANRLSVPFEHPTVRLPVQNQRFPFFLLGGLDGPVGAEVFL